MRLPRSVLASLTVAASVTAAALALSGPARAAAPGALDTGWAGTGIATTAPYSPGDDEGTAVARQQNGRIVVVGSAYDGTSYPHMAVVRYLTDGTLDTTFGSAGKAIVPSFFGTTASPDTNGDLAYAVALQPDGKILVAGAASHANGMGALAVTRYNTDGTPDHTFGANGNGRVTVRVGTGGYDDVVRGIAVQPDGGIVLAGAYAGGWTVARLTAAGVLDTTFDPSGAQPGVQAFNLGDSLADSAYAVSVETLSPSGFAIVVGGSAAHTPGAPGAFNEDFAVVRFTSAGAFDPTFGGGDGIATTNPGASFDAVTSLAVRSDGKIVVAGLGPAAALTVARFTAAGALDPTFAAGTGRVTLDVNGDPAVPATGLALMADGSILAADTSDNGDDDAQLVKLTVSGAVDTSFGTDGVVTTNIRTANSVDRVGGVVLDANGRLIVVGSSAVGSSTRWFAARYFTAAAATVTASPVDTVACGSTATFQATVTGAAPLHYAWQVLNPGASKYVSLVDGPTVSGSTTTALSLSSLTAADDGKRYHLTVTNPGGIVYSASALLTVGTAPAVTSQPTQISPGGPGVVGFTAAASGNPGPTQKWYVSVAGGAYTVIAGATSNPYTFTPTAAQNGDKYKAKFTNACGSVLTASATLVVS
ncbi:hypothetical protein [Jatrophihabitans sp.]|uniref:hypothetical protein n=1 Tax=Jatrophihabitans sp. TaxID=1932789 RepID=UPI0030C6B153|nr:hypothetical protein [Jatrophihabitans sp.]